MGNVAHVLSPAMVDALSTHFKDLDPPPYGGAPKDLMSEGEKIYHEGVPSAEVPACRSISATARTPTAWTSFRAWPANSTAT